MSKMQSMLISDDDCKKYGISIQDFQKYDKNGDHAIDANEFFGGAMSNLSIFNAFKSQALQNNAFVDNEGLQTNPAEYGANQKNGMQGLNNNQYALSNQYNLSHPNLKNRFLANNYDFMA